MDSVPESLSSLLRILGGARFRSLDMKLSTALGKVHKAANDPLTIDIALIEQKMGENGTMLMGRQIAWEIYMYFQSNPIMDFTFG
eukprot:14112788-Heterocapsa_arctica.AAC.1